MHPYTERVGRALTVAAALLCLGPPLAVALTGLHVPLPLALFVPVGVAIAAGTWWRTMPSVPLGLARRHPAIAALWVVVWCAAAGQIARASVFAYDVTRRGWSVAPANQFRSQHNCLTAYAEAARFAGEGGINLYDSTRYHPAPRTNRRIGPLTVDSFHYPPQFLLLPAAVRAVAPDFFDTRRVWFGLQVLLLAGVMLCVAWRIGGETGGRVALASLAFWALPTTFVALQTGNFQITGIPLALLGALLACSARPGVGGGLLAYATVGKHVAQVYAVLLAALAIVSGLRSRAEGPVAGERSCLDHAGMWLGLLNLASFAGPFVGGAYGSAGTAWLVALRSGGAGTPGRRWAWLAALLPTFLVPWITPSPGGGSPSGGMLVLSAAWQVWAVAVNAWAAWPPRAAADTPAVVVTAGAGPVMIPARPN